MSRLRRGTLGVDVRPATIAVDPGYSVGVGLRVGRDAVNFGTCAPSPDRRVEYRGVDDPLVFTHLRRIGGWVDWLADQYRHLGPFRYAVEMMDGNDARSNRAIIVRNLAVAVADRYDAARVHPRRPDGSWRPAGGLQQPRKGGSGDARDYYPAALVGQPPEYGWDSWDGEPVLMLPNEERRRRMIHVQAFFDIAGYAHLDCGRCSGRGRVGDVALVDCPACLGSGAASDVDVEAAA